MSCGSSAGNFVYTCDENNVCQNETDQNNQWIADGLCGQYESSGGCPGGGY